jgi:hypothetical protein
VQLEKVVQLLIKGPILISEASPCFIVPVIVEMDSSSIKIRALLDSEAFVCFIDKDFADCHKLPLVTKKHPIPIEVIDERPLVSGDVIYESTPLNIILEWHYSIIAFNVIKLPSNPIILGLSWLDKYNPAIDWKTWRLAFQPNIASIQESDYRETSSTLEHQQFKSHHKEISKIQVPIVVEARAFMRAIKKETMFAIYAIPIIESVKGPEALPTRYKEYSDVFEKKNVDMFPQYRLYDCAIDFQEGT